MILLMLNIRRRGILNSILLEDVPFVISTFVVLVDLEDIFSTSRLVLDYFSYSVIKIVIRMISLISVTMLYIQSLIAVIV